MLILNNTSLPTLHCLSLAYTVNRFAINVSRLCRSRVYRYAYKDIFIRRPRPTLRPQACFAELRKHRAESQLSARWPSTINKPIRTGYSYSESAPSVHVSFVFRFYCLSPALPKQPSSLDAKGKPLTVGTLTSHPSISSEPDMPPF